MRKSCIACMMAAMMVLASCNNAKDKINKAGEKVGEGTSEFFTGVSEGVDKTRECKVEVSDSLKLKGISVGKFTVQAPPPEHKSNNLVSVYLIFALDFRGPVSMKIYDESGNEYGRLNQNIAGNKGEAMFFDFLFDPRTDIEPRSRIVME